MGLSNNWNNKNKAHTMRPYGENRACYHRLSQGSKQRLPKVLNKNWI